MNIAIYLSDKVASHWGGGFTYQERLIAAISARNNVDGINFSIIKHKTYTACEFDLPVIEIKRRPRNSFLAKRIRRIRARSSQRYEDYVLSELERNGIQLLFYVHPHQALTNKFPFVVNNWDLAHITCSGFPEVSKDLDHRRRWVEDYLRQALHVFAESESGKREIAELIQIPENQISVVPMFSGKIIDLRLSEKSVADILAELGLINEQFLFYPAQFWALKNHYNLLLAFRDFLETVPTSLKLVFVGSDKENMTYITSLVDRFSLTGRVKNLGYVDNPTLFSLYKRSVALVFPTLLGPTNMPLLEAMELGCPVLCSALDGHKEMLPGYSGFFDPLDYLTIVDQFKKIADENYRKELVEQLARIRENSPFKIETSVNAIFNTFKVLEAKRSCWA